MKPGYTGIERIRKASQFSMKGLQAAWEESAFRQEVALGVALVPLSFWLGQTLVETAVLITSYAIVLIAELLNTAIEAVVDRVGHEHHDLAGRAKDIASAAVALSLLLLGAVWALVAAHRFL
ncbi:MAG: diacylglycerol kinase [Gammaproteobacteria bacterium]|nr:diacylglycerol kinase [Gammaproteobacteria bacterium]MDE0364984.1 diacylglycerol kinase [Gammaproteobacteria bacterium]